MHDIAITQSQGTIHEQSGEHLSSSDVAIVRARRMLDEAASAVAEGQDPAGVVRSAADNDFRDMVVVTGEIAKDESKEAYCQRQMDNRALFLPQTTPSTQSPDLP